jgi:hypothetical protein
MVQVVPARFEATLHVILAGVDNLQRDAKRLHCRRACAA